MNAPSVSAGEAGRYVQYSAKLRFMRGNTEVVSERPRDSDRRFTDNEFQTRVVFREGDAVDIPFLVSIGAIAKDTAPRESVKGPKHGQGQ